MKVSVIVVALLAAVTSMPAAAYIDPGSGSAIMSAIIGFFVAIAMAIKTYWYKIKSWFSGSKKTAVEDSPRSDDAASSKAGQLDSVSGQGEADTVSEKERPVE